MLKHMKSVGYKTCLILGLVYQPIQPKIQNNNPNPSTFYHNQH